MKTRKFILALIVLTALSVANSTVVLAVPPSVIEPPEAVQPYWDNTSFVNVTLSFTGTTANVGAVVRGFSGTSRITATAILSRRNASGTFSTIQTWRNLSADGTMLTFSDTHAVTRGYTYRLTINANVTRNGSTEAVSNWIDRALQ
ncbi:MAG: hypothetical protein FWC20_08875 [Oscillospiraceae bacterium]|nr:hypothetical protein [Oscillospiraceae bacterium]MCL2279502.1 hypothetical protein [Oscillospiraceae bacterium]